MAGTRKKPKTKKLAPRAKKPDPYADRQGFTSFLPARQAGVRVTEDTALTLGAVFGCVRVITEDIAGLPWRVMEGMASGKGSVEVPEDPADWIINTQASPETPAFQFRETILAHALTWGNGYAEVERDGAGRPFWLWLLTPDRVEPRRAEDGRIVYEVKSPAGSPVFLEAADVFHLRGLGFDGLKGYSVVQLAARSIGAGIALDQATADFFGNDSTPGGMLTHPGRLSATARQNLIESWERRHAGPTNRRRVAVLEEGMKWDQTGLPPEDTQLIQQKQFTPADICFTPGCQVLTSTGFRPIEEIKPGELVLTHRGRWRRVNACLSRNYAGDVVTVKAKGWGSVTATVNHPFYVQDVRPSLTNALVPSGPPVWREAGALAPVPKKVNGNRPRGTYTNLVMPRIAAAPVETIDLAGMVSPDFAANDQSVRADGSHNGKAVCRHLPADYRLGWLVGLFTADGSTNDHQTVFYLGAHETGLVRTLRQYLGEVFGVDSSVAMTGEGSVARVCASSKVLACFFSQFGHVAHEKKFSRWCLERSAEFRFGLLAGLVAGDGGEYRKDTYLRTTSHDLAWQVRLLLWADGRNSGLEYSPPGVMEIEGRCHRARESWIVRWRTVPEVRGSLGVGVSHVYSPLKHCESAPYQGWVYNLEVEEDESYTTIGGVVHNCRWFRVKPHKIADLSRSTFSNIESENTSHVIDTLLPWARRLETEANIKLFGRTNRGRRFTKINFNAFMRGDAAARATFYTQMIDRGVFSINDALALEDRNPIGPDGDKRFVPMNMQLLEQAGEEPPPSPPEPPSAENAPPSDGPPSEMPPVPGESMRAALRPVFEDACRRLLRAESQRARSAVADGKALPWFDRVRDDHAEVVRNALSPAASALALACGVVSTVAERALAVAVGLHLHELRERLTGADAAALDGWEALAGETAAAVMAQLSLACGLPCPPPPAEVKP